MIVHCTGCQARFRVADERVGARGARIRCSRCRTLFTIGPAGAPASTPAPSPLTAGPPEAPAPEVELETPAPSPPPAADDPFAGFRLDLGLSPGSQRGAPDLAGDPFAAGDPFGAAPLDLATGPGPAAGWPADPLAAGGTAQVASLAAGEARGDDPAWAGAAAGPADLDGAAGAAPLDLGAPPGAPAWMDDPFAAALSPRAERASLSERALPLTDLSDLVGEGPRPPAVPPPLPPARGAPPFPGEPRLDLEGPDLALEEPRQPSPPARAPDDDPLGGFPFAAPRHGEVGAGPSELGALAAPEEEPLALATEAAPALPEMWRTGPVHQPEPEEPTPSTAPAAAPDAPADPSAPPATAARGGALRPVAVNALSLAALLVVALGFRLVWRGEGVTAPATSPAALLRALGVGGRPAAALETAGVSSGRYPRAEGAPLLLVRGEVISRAPGPLARVRVDVEVVRGGRVLAARSAPAGAVPTPEELHAVKDAAGLDALSAAVARRARAVGPGAPVPFLVAFVDVPEDLTGAALRVVATAAP